MVVVALMMGGGSGGSMGGGGGFILGGEIQCSSIGPVVCLGCTLVC